jgi:sterol desaturase/sphingolipid hydroxylase (fatty acid hydroxylase superfamily)
MSLSLLSPVVIVLAALFIVLLERWRPYAPQQSFLREGFWNDLILYSIVQSYLAGLLISFLITWIDDGTGLSRLRLVSDWPLWLQVSFFLVTHDLYIYFFHRLQHRSLRLWRLHEAHHSTKDVDWLSGSRSHAFEILINQTVEFAPIVLLGAAPEVALIKGMISAVWGMWIHANIDVHTGPLQYIINGPEMHRWHHSDVVADGSTNFATKLAVWDWIFGTAQLPREIKPKGYGIREIDFPDGYVRQHLFAFRPFRTGEYEPTE